MEADYDDDGVLVAALRQGDAAAFEWMIDRYHASLHRFARNYVASSSDAADVVQETWLALIEGIDRFERRSTIKTWLYRVLMNKARTRGVREQRTRPFSSLGGDDLTLSGFDPGRFRSAEDPHWPGHWAAPPTPWHELPDRHLEATATLDIVREAIADLPPNQRQVLALRDIDGWTSSEVCNVLGLSQTNQRVLLHRARAKVRLALDPSLGRAI